MTLESKPIKKGDLFQVSCDFDALDMNLKGQSFIAEDGTCHERVYITLTTKFHRLHTILIPQDKCLYIKPSNEI